MAMSNGYDKTGCLVLGGFLDDDNVIFGRLVHLSDNGRLDILASFNAQDLIVGTVVS
jgi:hypothetical protein